MRDIRDSDVPSEQLIETLEDIDVGTDIVNGDYSPAKIDTPDVPRVEDIPVRPASTEEGDTEAGLEVKSGTAEAGENRGWYEVEFGEPFDENLVGRPIVNATATQRTGEFSLAEYQPPGIRLDGVGFVDVGDIQLGQISVGSVDGGRISVGEITSGEISVDGVDIGDISISIRSIRERQLEHVADITQSGVSIDMPRLDGDIQFGEDLNVDVNLDFTDIDLDEDLSNLVDTSDINDLFDEFQEFDPVRDWQTIEDRFVNNGYDLGEELYNVMDDNLPNINVPGTDWGPKSWFMGAWDTGLQLTYGHGRTRYGGTGVYEAIYSILGSTLDDSLEYIVERFIGHELDMVEKTHDNVSQLRSDIVEPGGLVDTLEDIMEAEIGGALQDQLTNTESLMGETDQTFSGVGNEVENAANQVVNEVDSEIVAAIQDLQAEINAFAQQDIEQSFADIDGGLSEAEAEINELSLEVSDELGALSEDIDITFTDLTDQLDREINLLSDDVEIALNDRLADTEQEINAVLRDQEQDINEVLAVVEEDVNINLQDLADDINAVLEGSEVQTNGVILDLQDQLNDIMDDINRNNDDLEVRLNSALSEITAQAEASVNESLRVLYDTMGMPEGELMVPVQVRNVDNTGFEFLGYEGGTTIDWTAMSRSGAGNIVGTPPDRDDGDGSDGGPEIPESVIDEIVERLEERIGDDEGIGARRN